MFFTELCLKNPNIPSSTLINYIFNTLENMNNEQKKDYLRRVIRGYSIFINDKISKYFSILFGDNFTVEKIINASPATKHKIQIILRDLIDLEMNLSTDPNYVKKYLKEVSTEIEKLNRGLQNISNQGIEYRANLEREIVLLLDKKNLYETHENFNVFSNPSETISQGENNGQILKKMKANDVSKPEKIKSCPEGKEINPKTGRCVKPKTQKVRKNKTPKQQVKIVDVPQPKKIEIQPVPEPKKIRSCPEGKEINPKTGRCVKSKTKTQKIRKNKTPKQQVKIVDVPQPKKIEIQLVPEPKKIEVPVVPEPKKIKSCPEGKELNPKTGRCVKIKTQNVKIPLKNKEIVCPKGCIKKPE